MRVRLNASGRPLLRGMGEAQSRIQSGHRGPDRRARVERGPRMVAARLFDPTVLAQMARRLTPMLPEAIARPLDLPQISDRVYRVWQRLLEVAAGDRPSVRLELNLLETDSRIAFAHPSGRIDLSTGMLASLGKDSELAFILGRLIGEVVLSQLDRQIMAILGAEEGMSQGQPLSLDPVGLRVGRERVDALVLEADLYGLDVASRAGFDPASAVAVLRRLVPPPVLEWLPETLERPVITRRARSGDRADALARVIEQRNLHHPEPTETTAPPVEGEPLGFDESIEQGRYLEVLQQQLEILERASEGVEPSGQATLPENLPIGRILLTSGMLELAEAVVRPVVGHLRAHRAPGDVERLAATRLLAEIERVSDRPERARDLLEELLRPAEEALGPDHVETLEIRKSLASLAVFLEGDPRALAEGESLAKRAESLWGGQDPRAVSVRMGWLQGFLTLHDSPKAFDSIQDALLQLSRSGAGSLRVLQRLDTMTAALLAARLRLTAAIAVLQSAHARTAPGSPAHPGRSRELLESLSFLELQHQEPELAFEYLASSMRAGTEVADELQEMDRALLPLVSERFGRNALPTISVLEHRGSILFDQNQFHEARLVQESALRRLEAHFADQPGHPRVAEARLALVRTLRVLGEYRLARDHLVELRDAHASSGTPDPTLILTVAGMLAGVEAELGNMAEALKEHRELLNATRGMAERDLLRINARVNLGQTLRLQGDLAAAFEQLTTAHRGWVDATQFGRNGPHALKLEALLGRVLSEMGGDRDGEALVHFEYALPRLRALFGDDDPAVISTQGEMSALLRRSGRFDEAQELLLTALTASSRVLGSHHPLTRRLLDQFPAQAA